MYTYIYVYIYVFYALEASQFLGGLVEKNLSMQEIQETQIWSLSGRSLEEEMFMHFTILAWKISWIEEPGRLQSMRLQSQAQLNDWV